MPLQIAALRNENQIQILSYLNGERTSKIVDLDQIEGEAIQTILYPTIFW